MKKKSQLTIFMVLGLVVFTIFGLIFYMKNSVKSQEFTEEKQEVTDLFTTQGKYYGYMQSCLDEVTKQGVILVGLQGGVIYQYEANGTKPYLGPKKYEYGQYILPFAYENIIYNVSYGIYAPDFSVVLEGHPSIPDYPYGLTKLVETPKEVSSIYVNSFGNVILNPMPPLCDYYGSNSPNQTGALYSCETYDSKRKSDNDNIQEYLQIFIAQGFKECVDLENLPEFTNTTMKSGNVTITVTFSPSSIAVEAEYPIVAELAEKESTLSLQTFHTTLNVRLKQMHELAERLIQNDVNNIFFNIVRDANELVDCKEPGKESDVVRCLKQGMHVTKYRDVCTQCKNYGKYDDIVVIQDNQSTINGKPFVFAFAVQNRYPALDLIDDSSEEYDIVAKVGDPFTITPMGYDPDEDDHNAHDFMDNRYIYGGWKEDYEESGGLKIPADTNGFSESSLFLSTNRTAEYTPQLGEEGEHTVQVLVCDNEGLCDYQYITIYVKSIFS
ncbi:MAG: hypothetical protein WC254_04005 [Candidatus Woesearchaeota archaeon]|jgi:hypothetical protein